MAITQDFVQDMAELPAEDGAAGQGQPDGVGPKGEGALLVVRPQNDPFPSVKANPMEKPIFPQPYNPKISPVGEDGAPAPPRWQRERIRRACFSFTGASCVLMALLMLMACGRRRAVSAEPQPLGPTSPSSQLCQLGATQELGGFWKIF